MVKRYDIWMYYDDWQEEIDADGDWVKYEDHAAELATLRDEVEELKQIIVGQCRVITELRIKLASDAIKSFADEALK